MPDTTRAFIAIKLDDKTHNELGELESTLKASNADVKWVASSNIHLTLKFLGNITDQQIIQIKDLLKTIASNFKPYKIRLSKIGAFPNISSLRVIWVGMDEGADQTSAIYESVEEALSKIGFAKEGRLFSPHLTLGRVRSSKNIQGLKRIIEKEKDFSSLIKVLVEEIILFKSTLTRSGSIYEAIFKASLDKT